MMEGNKCANAAMTIELDLTRVQRAITYKVAMAVSESLPKVGQLSQFQIFFFFSR